MSTFKVGEVCVFQNALWDLTANGTDVLVIGPLKMRPCRYPDGSVRMEYAYAIRRGGIDTPALPQQLRKKSPPRREIDTLVSWSECAWKPSGVRA